MPPTFAKHTAGSRYLYICEDGLVHWCSQQRGHPGIKLERYGEDDLRREYHEVKKCAPFCTVGCVHRVAQLDELRHDPEAALAQWFSDGAGLPAPVRVLRWAFITSPRRHLFRAALSRMFGAARKSSKRCTRNRDDWRAGDRSGTGGSCRTHLP